VRLGWTRTLVVGCPDISTRLRVFADFWSKAVAGRLLDIGDLRSMRSVETGANGADREIRVGFTEAHGMADEASRFGPAGVRYSFLRPHRSSAVIRSPIKGYLRHFETTEHDLIEAVLSPVVTAGPWIYSCANFQESTAFSLLECPVPRFARVAYIRHLLARDNCKKVIFWSNAGRRTLESYGGLGSGDSLHRKVTVVYPAVRTVPDTLIRFSDRDVTLLFTGDFFRKGGVNVVDAFERARQRYPSLKLRVCCDERIDFNTQNAALRTEYLNRIRLNPGIELLGRIPRERLVLDVLPTTDIYLLPTYAEAFGVSILEAMAFGIPVVATNGFAIPEMVEDGTSGFLIDISRFDSARLFRGYVVNDIPADFRDHVTDHLFEYLCRLIESVELRKRFGLAGMEIARTKFSFETRNATMRRIYCEALQ
jgi:glycosyltransferase involved in cell wall biosynthesis